MNLLEVSGVSKKFGDLHALKNISFSLGKNDALYVNGGNGAGKTTLLEVISGLLLQTSGQLTVNAQTVTGVFEDPFLYPDMTVEENLVFFAQLYGVINQEERISDLLKRFALKDKMDCAVKQLSLGMEKKVSIARALIAEPVLLLLDEPFNGLDTDSRREMSSLIKQMRSDRCIIFTSHDTEMVSELATHVLLLKAGAQEFFGPKEEGLKLIR